MSLNREKVYLTAYAEEDALKYLGLAFVVLAVFIAVNLRTRSMRARLCECKELLSFLLHIKDSCGIDGARPSACSAESTRLRDCGFFDALEVGASLSAAFSASLPSLSLNDGERQILERIFAELDKGDTEAAESDISKLHELTEELSVCIPRDIKLWLVLSACAVAALLLIII